MSNSIESSPKFVAMPGQLPAFWPRRVAFFANLLAMFFGNESQTRALTAEVGEIDSYGARLIPVLNLLFRSNDNLLILERSPDEALCEYLSHDLGLSLPSLQVQRHSEYIEIGKMLAASKTQEVTQSLRDIAGHPTEWIDGYVTDVTLAGIAQHLGRRTLSTTTASRDGNNKLLLHQFLEASGLPVFDTFLASAPADVPGCALRLEKLGYRKAVLRAQIGASGIGMLILADLSKPELFPEIPEHLFFEGECMVQGWLEPGVAGVTQIRSPSTQLFANEDTVFAFDMTEQILSHDSVHQGNESPPQYFDDFPGLREETMRMAEAAGAWLQATGYRGTASIDWLIAEREGKRQPDVYVCEINARVTGATYPSLLARHFCPEGAWLLRNLRLRKPLKTPELLAMFDAPRHLFRPDRRNGIIPLNLNFGSDGLVHKGQFLCLGASTDECHRFLALAEQDLPIDWHLDRD
jgi:hypothetical protein